MKFEKDVELSNKMDLFLSNGLKILMKYVFVVFHYFFIFRKVQTVKKGVFKGQQKHDLPFSLFQIHHVRFKRNDSKEIL